MQCETVNWKCIAGKGRDTARLAYVTDTGSDRTKVTVPHPFRPRLAGRRSPQVDAGKT
jgi:hypothetical protein